MSHPPIRVRGCRVHNLKDVDVDLPRHRLNVLCGVSGSGKTSLALETLYAEGQRCYIESFSAYARQFLDRLDKPDCEEISGIPPAIAVTRKGTTKTNRSTVGTATEIADHLRLLFAKAGNLICHGCGQPVLRDDPESVADWMTRLGPDARAMIGFPVWLPNRKTASDILMALQQEGYLRLIVKGQTFRLSDEDRGPLSKRVTAKGTEAIVVVDRVSGRDDRSRLTESLETAMTEGYGKAVVLISSSIGDTGPKLRKKSSGKRADRVGEATTSFMVGETIDDRVFHRRIISEARRCDHCDIEYPEPVPRLFNFNHPLGACPQCEGFGDIVDYDMDLVVPDASKTLREGAIAPWNTPAYRHELDELLQLADEYELPVDIPYSKLKKKHLKLIREGVPERNFGGLEGFFAWLERKKYKMHVRVFASRYRRYRKCPRCDGDRLRDEALAYRLDGHSIAELMRYPAKEILALLSAMPWDERQAAIVREPVRQIRDRLGYLETVGLGYLSLDRTLRTLSGGETQRVALTSALGSSLVNMLYVLDEPTAGLHPCDVQRLCESIVGLRDRGNTVLVVEHNETMIRRADWVAEVGPGAGTAGGTLTFQGTPDQLLREKDSLTGQFLTGRRGGTLQNRSPRDAMGWIELRGASGHNLQEIDVRFPTGVLCLVTGVSGSGKSSLVQDTLFPAVSKKLNPDQSPTTDLALPYRSIIGLSGINDCLLIDQSAISRSARSCPVTYVKAFDPIRNVFAETVTAKTRNFGPGHFSFNSAKGQCPKCEGAGVLEVDMQFLADVSMPCPACRGRRYRDDILNATFRDRSIADILAMTVTQAYHFFRGHAKVQARLKRMIDVGLDYVTLGQPATTLSGGEGQRLKLAAFLGSASRKKTLFIMDEPTTGLHFADIVKLVDCFDALLADGHSLIVVEHNVMLMRAADYVIDLGPGAADDGGRVVAQGTPAEIAEEASGPTARALAATIESESLHT